MIAIAKDCVVSLRYIMKNSSGAVLENTMETNPVCYLQGASGIQPLLQVQLEGLKAGDRKCVHLVKESGLTVDDFTFDVLIDEVREALPEELFLGYPILQSSKPCEADCACYIEPAN